MEIGSEFWNVPVCPRKGNIFPENTQWYQSGRGALRAVISRLHIRTAALPAWCCHTMIQPFLDAGIEVRFYPVYPGQNQLVQELRMDCDALFVMDYFGYTSTFQALRSYGGIVVRDVTHSIFSNTYRDADYVFGSLRKWCGVWTGGYAWTRSGKLLPAGEQPDVEHIMLRRSAMECKQRYLQGDKGEADKRYLDMFSRAEERLNGPTIRAVAKRDVEAAIHLDTTLIKERRRQNAIVLREAFTDWLIFSEMREKDCPLFVPILVPNNQRDKLRKYLIQHGIYCPIHWPLSESHRVDKKTAKIYDQELSLVCDQRYTEEDMRRIVTVIRQFILETGNTL